MESRVMNLSSSLLKPPSLFFHNPQIYRLHYKKSLSPLVISQLKATKERREKENVAEKIIVSEDSPPLSGKKRKNKGGKNVWVKVQRKVLTVLSNLSLAIGEMVSIAALMALGTIIEQGEAPDFYFQKYPEYNPVLGFFTWRWIFTLGFDHMFSSPIFLSLLVLLAASLMACTCTTQIPLVKVARRWSFLQASEAISKQDLQRLYREHQSGIWVSF